LEREIKAISPNLLRYNRYLQINRDLVYLHKENIEINAKSSQANLNQQIKLNLIQPIKEKLNISNSALAQRRLFQPITSNIALFGQKLLSPSIYEPYSIDQLGNNTENNLNRKEWTKNTRTNKLNSRILPYSNLEPYRGFNSLLNMYYEPTTHITPLKNKNVKPSLLGSFKTQRIAKDVKRWAIYQEIVGEREISTSHKKWGRTRKTKGLRVVRFGHPNPYFFKTHSDFKSQVIPKAFGRRRIRSSISPSYADWQFENRINSNPIYKKIDSYFWWSSTKEIKD